MAENTTIKALSLHEKLECSVCLDIFEKPIRQCIKGHSFCTKCIDPQNIKSCPECRSQILDTRNYKLEELLDGINFPCENKVSGCPYMLKKPELQEHQLECQYRTLKCEGQKFCNWNCNWEGNKLLEHFKEKHLANSTLEYNATISIPYNNTSNFSDLQLISAHYQLFWYKHKIDVDKGMAYWAFQMIGLRKQTLNYYYEFEFFMTPPSIRKYKIIELCSSDLQDIDEIFESEKCVAISLKTLKNFVGKQNEYSFRFRLMKIKKDNPVEVKPVKKSQTNVQPPPPQPYLLPHPGPTFHFSLAPPNSYQNHPYTINKNFSPSQRGRVPYQKK